MADANAVTSDSDDPQPPFMDVGAGIFVMGSREAFLHQRATLARLGKPRVAMFDTPPLVERDIWPGFVTNINDPQVLAALNNPTGAITLVFNDPHTAAAQMLESLHAFGVEAWTVPGSVAGDDDRDLVFIVVDKAYLTCGLYVFRVPAHKMVGPHPEPPDELLEG